MSRAQQNPTGRLRLGVAGLAAVLATAACSSGQITQTDSQLPAVNGALAQAGNIAIRDAMLAYPADGSYAEGSDAPLTLSIVNSAGTADKLVDVSSPVATSVQVDGDVNLPGRTAVVIGEVGKTADGKSVAPTTPTPSTTTTTTPSTTSAATTTGKPSSTSSAPTTTTTATTTTAPTTTTTVELGKGKIVLKGLTLRLFPGKTVPVTFVFQQAGPVTVNLPIAAPTGSREG
ncbi:hypothetical protein [Actinokineospora inagensis]|uniref:hypothetical protein n=1 Tax=Actinokineospora inagensis TaxID=103730 RepID=UPI000407400D|nr:hypothetical protein [Actinokineospora inagensis]